MKLKIINFDSKNVFGSIKQAVFTSALSYAKMYELLHKQIWRKDRGRISIATLSSIPTFNGRPVGFVQKWDIKSQYTYAYSYNGGAETFGLNQLFMGQDFRSEYQGDPGDGIYHDDCYIAPKSIDGSFIASGYRNMFCFTYLDNTESYQKYKYYREDLQGNVVIENVYYEQYMLNNEEHTRLIILYKNGTKNIVELSIGLTELKVSLETCNGRSKIADNDYSRWADFTNAFPEHGTIVSQYETSYRQYSGLSAKYSFAQLIFVFEDGTVIQFIPEHMIMLKDYPKIINSQFYILPMIYLDTGDLAMDRVDFVDKWDEYFELIVHEDGEWWQDLIRPISLIIAAIIIYCSWGALSPLAKAIVVIGYAVYAVGVITNNTDLMLIGGIMMAGVSLYTAFESFTTTTATTSAQLSTMSTEQALAGTAFSETFTGYASAAGMENLLVMPTVESYTSLTLEGLTATSAPYAELGAQAGMSVADYVSLSGANAFSIDSLMSIGKELYSAYNNTNQLLKKNTTSSSKTSDTSDDSGMRITVKSSDEEDDVMQYIKKVIDIL